MCVSCFGLHPLYMPNSPAEEIIAQFSIKYSYVNTYWVFSILLLIWMRKCRLTACVTMPVKNCLFQNLVLSVFWGIILQVHVIFSFKLSSLLETQYNHLTLIHRVTLQNCRPNDY